MQSEAVLVTLRVTQVLDELQVPYVIGGSMASTAHGRIRATMDVDIVADLPLEVVEALVYNLDDDFYADAEMMRQAIGNQGSFNLIHLATAFKVDIFIAGERPFEQQQLARRQAQLLQPPDRMAYFASPEDVILAKLDWYRRGGEVSEHQWRDIQGVLDVQGEQLDRDYMQHWAEVLSVTDLFTAALAEYEERQGGDE
jgi:hypothetical protein